MKLLNIIKCPIFAMQSRLLRHTADLGDLHGMQNYGRLIKDKNKLEAFKYFKLAIQNGNQDAINDYNILLNE